MPAKYKRTNAVVKYSMEWLGSRIRDRNVPNAKQLCAMIREERAEELSRAGMENNAARKPERRAIAIRKNGEAVRECLVETPA